MKTPCFFCEVKVAYRRFRQVPTEKVMFEFLELWKKVINLVVQHQAMKLGKLEHFPPETMALLDTSEGCTWHKKHEEIALWCVWAEKTWKELDELTESVRRNRQ